VSSDPLAEIRAERERARAEGDANTDLCCLATIDASGLPAVRMLVLREVSDSSLAVFCSRSSPKFEQLQNPESWELLVFWPSIKRQFRVRGRVEEIPAEEIRDNWVRRPHGSKLLDHYHARVRAQSTEIGSRADLLEEMSRLEQELSAEGELTFPSTATGFRLFAERVEAWRESLDRIHDRRHYALVDGLWSERVLVP
jgi:pyridoxamine 5'-phosphate oxidase